MGQRDAMRDRVRWSTDEREAQLLELGLGLFGRRAYDEIAIEDIAAAAGISKGLLYHYFGGKRAYYVAVVRHAAERLRQGLDAAAGPAGSATTRLRSHFEFVAAHPDVYAAFTSGGLGADPEVAHIVERTREAIVDGIVAELGGGRTGVLLRVGLRAWVAGVEAATQVWLDRREPPMESLVHLLGATLRATIGQARRLDRLQDVPAAARPPLR